MARRSAITVAPVSWPETYEAVGTVRSRTAAVIASRITGYIRQVPVRVGERVAAGQLLVTLEARDLDAHSEEAEAVLAEGRSALPEAEGALAAAQAQVDLAQATFRRFRTTNTSNSHESARATSKATGTPPRARPSTRTSGRWANSVSRFASDWPASRRLVYLCML